MKEQAPRYATQYDFVRNALVGALAELAMVGGDYQALDSIALWSIARAQLFCSRELFNDLPPVWDPQALAYYRSNNGNYVRYKPTGTGQYSYIGELPGGGENILFTSPQQ